MHFYVIPDYCKGKAGRCPVPGTLNRKPKSKSSKEYKLWLKTCYRGPNWIFVPGPHARLVICLMTGAIVIFCTRELNRSVLAFKMESDPLQTSMSDLRFKPSTHCPVTSALTTRHGQPVRLSISRTLLLHVTVSALWEKYMASISGVGIYFKTKSATRYKYTL